MKLKSFIYLIFFLSVVVGQAQLRSLNYGSIAERNYLTIIRFEMMGDKLIVPVSIEGQTYRFLLDTGAPNIISKELDSILNPKEIGSLPTSDATGKRSRLKVVAVKSLQFGDVSFENTATLVYDLNDSAIFRCFDIDGFIGSNMLRKSIIQIDAETKTIILTNNKKNLILDKKQSTKIRLTKNQSSPYLWIKLKGEESGREELLIDTGADDLYDLSKQHYSIFKEKTIFEFIGKAEGASSISLFGDAPVNTQFKLLLPKLEVNGFEIENVVTQTTNDDNSRIGARLLQYGKMTLDYKGKRFYFQPYELSSPEINYDYGFSNTYIKDKLSIGFVWDASLTDKIAFGDEVLAINDFDINETTLCDLVSDTIRPRSKPIMKLKVRNQQGEINEFLFDGKIWLSNN